MSRDGTLPGISVIVPVFNRERFLGEALRSVLEQGYPGPLEVIVSDDGSTDGSLAVARSRGEPVRLLLKPPGCKSQGAAGARNRGLSAVAMPYVAFLDSDDYFLPGHLERMARRLTDAPQAGYAVSRLVQMRDTNGVRLFAQWTKSRVTQRDVNYPIISGGCVVHTNTFLFRRSVFDVTGGFDESYSNHEDGDLWIRISEHFSGVFSDHVGAVYRVSHGSGQLTDGQDSPPKRECLRRVVCRALQRALAARPPDAFRVFRLRLMLASLEPSPTRALMKVALQYPVRTAATAFSLERIRNRAFKPHWSPDPFNVCGLQKDPA